MPETTVHTDSIDTNGRPYRPYPVHKIPKTRTNALSILRAFGDDPQALTEAQRQAIRRLYRIDGDNRSVQQIIEDEEVDGGVRP